MSTSSDASAQEVLGRARQLSGLTQKVRTLAVLKALLVYEESWERVAEALGLEEAAARRIYGEAQARWMAGDPEPWLPQPAPARPLLRWIRGGRGDKDGPPR